MGDIDRYIEIISETYKSEKSIKFIASDKVLLKCDCNNVSIVNGVREPILYSFALSSPSGLEKFKEPRIKLFKKITKSVLSHITFCLEDDDHKPVDFYIETIRFTCQLNKIY